VVSRDQEEETETVTAIAPRAASRSVWAPLFGLHRTAALLWSYTTSCRLSHVRTLHLGSSHGPSSGDPLPSCCVKKRARQHPFRPVDVAVARDGQTLFACDMNAGCVHVLRTADGTHVRTIGHEGNGPGEFQGPVALCLYQERWLVVAEFLGCRVQVLEAETGLYRSEYAIGGLQPLPPQMPQDPRPYGPSFCRLSEQDGLLYVTDFIAHHCIVILRIDPDTGALSEVRRISSILVAGGVMEEPLGSVSHLTLSSDGQRLFFASYMPGQGHPELFDMNPHNRLVRQAFELSELNEQAHSFQGLCLSEDGSWLFVSDVMYRTVSVYNIASGRRVQQCKGVARFPLGLCLSPTQPDLLFVADSHSHAIHVFQIQH
jgi:6-phosphogluconolactonase (cycloisomerase 2 family)